MRERDRMRWDESGGEPVTMIPSSTSKEATMEPCGAAPVTALASREPVEVPTAKRRAGRRSERAVADLSPIGLPNGTPTRSEAQSTRGPKERSAMRYVALDLGAKKTSYCEVAEGRVVRRATVSLVDSLQSELGATQPPATVAIEACREAWHVHDLLTCWGNEVVLVDTTRSRRLGIGQHGRKTDRIDAEVLALALERGGIPMAHVLSPHRRELRRWLGVRRALVESRAQLVTIARGLARERGVRLPSCRTEHFASNVRKKSLDEQTVVLIAPLLKLLDTIDAELVGVEAELSKLCESEPIVSLLATAPGVGAIVAASFVSVIDEAKRFRSAHHVESYVGLVPSEDTTGGNRRIGAISKHGNSYLRALMVQAAWVVLRTGDRQDPLRLWAEALAARRGKRVAVVGLARRLVGLLWAMWRDGTVYDASTLGTASSRGVRRAAQTLERQATALKRATTKRSMKCLLIKEVATTT
jgi:transposase